MLPVCLVKDCISFTPWLFGYHRQSVPCWKYLGPEEIGIVTHAQQSYPEGRPKSMQEIHLCFVYIFYTVGPFWSPEFPAA